MSPVPEERGADGSLFEALERMHAPDAALRQRLGALGVDLDRLDGAYPSSQWAGAVKLFREARYPELEEKAGLRRLGYDFAKAFGQTVSGALLLATLPLFGPENLLNRWPRFVRMGRTDVVLTVTSAGPHSISIHSVDPALVPAVFNIGMFDFVFERMRAQVTIALVSEDGPVAVMEFSWT